MSRAADFLEADECAAYEADRGCGRWLVARHALSGSIILEDLIVLTGKFEQTRRVPLGERHDYTLQKNVI